MHKVLEKLQLWLVAKSFPFILAVSLDLMTTRKLHQYVLTSPPVLIDRLMHTPVIEKSSQQ